MNDSDAEYGLYRGFRLRRPAYAAGPRQDGEESMKHFCDAELH